MKSQAAEEVVTGHVGSPLHEGHDGPGHEDPNHDHHARTPHYHDGGHHHVHGSRGPYYHDHDDEHQRTRVDRDPAWYPDS